MKLLFPFTEKCAPESGPALNVEMTSYVLLSLVKLGSNQDLLKARSIVRWLSKQRNSEGGFISTQDTVVALQVIKHSTTRKVWTFKNEVFNISGYFSIRIAHWYSNSRYGNTCYSGWVWKLCANSWTRPSGATPNRSSISFGHGGPYRHFWWRKWLCCSPGLSLY